MKKGLIFTVQPPSSSGVQAYRLSKILPFLEKYGWELHFVGPDPRIASLYQESVQRGNELCHYTRNIAPSLYFSIKRNRTSVNSLVIPAKVGIQDVADTMDPRLKHSGVTKSVDSGMTRVLLGSISRVFYGICQAVSMILEKVFRFDAFKYLEKGMIEEATKALIQQDYQLIAGYTPDFKILEIAYGFARLHQKPLLAIYDDPYGAREAGRFYPAEPEKQKESLDFASGAIFQSPLTRDRYVEQNLVTAQKAFVIHDSFPDISDNEDAGVRDLQKINMVHLGNLPAYRPIDPMLQAIEAYRSQPGKPGLELDFYGYVYPEAIRKVKTSAGLSQAIRIHKEVTHSESHEIAGRSDVLLVVIGPRHTDNCPSKFFEYLCHPKPVLVLGPKGNPVEGVLRELQVGEYCDVEDSGSIKAGLAKIISGYCGYQEAYRKNKALLAGYSAPAAAAKWAAILDQTLAQSSR
jgi:hypothetical protein